MVPVGATRRTILNKCPLCRQGAIELAAKQTASGTSYLIEPCGVCGAIFAPNGDGHLRLGYCNPKRLAIVKGKTYPQSVCSDCLPGAACWIGQTLSRAHWSTLAKGGIIESWAADDGSGLDTESEMSPAYLPEALNPYITADEVVRHASTITLGEMVMPGDIEDEAQLLLTSYRLVFMHQSMVFDIRLADIERIEPFFPGFVIKARSVGYPLYCFPAAPGDPVYHAILDALKRIH